VVDYDNLVIESCAEFRILPAIHSNICPNVEAFCGLGPPLTKRRSLKCHAASNHCHKTPAGFKSKQSLFNVSCTKRRPVAIYAATSGRKRRVHHDGMEGLLRWQKVIEPLSVKGCRLKALK
jgi:hypothetical protein